MTLQTPIYKLPLTSPELADTFSKVGVNNVLDLLNYFPRTYMDTRNVISLKELVDKSADESEENLFGTILVQITKNSMFKTKYGKSIVITKLKDENGTEAEIFWFNQTFMLTALKVGEFYMMFAKLANDSKANKIKLQVSEYENVKDGKRATHLDKITPIYRETKGISSKLIRSKLTYIFKSLGFANGEMNKILPDELSPQIRYENNLIDLDSAICNIHFPENFELLEKAKARLAFDEIYKIMKQVENLKLQRESVRAIGIKYKIDKLSSLNHKEFSAKEMIFNIDNFIKLDFKLTSGQSNSLIEILNDLSKLTPMSRLLQGEVGSGKTIVTLISAFLVLNNGYDVAFLAPTTILAKQHYENILKYKELLVENFDFNIRLITSDKDQDIKAVETETKIPQLFIGTHALLYEDKKLFDHTALVIVDEQHRFGVEQREQLLGIPSSGKVSRSERDGRGLKFSPHYLMLTATPIPRSVGEVYFADLDISTINTLPTNRQKIETFVVPEEKRDDGYNWIKKELQNGGQCYVVCPLVEESEKLDLKNVKKEFEFIKERFSEYKVDLLYGKLKINEKTKIIEKFKKNEIQILVSTQVIEVGIDVPNANIMVIESAERFGLAQLHQLRGRVGRGSRKSYCLLFKTIKSTESVDKIGNNLTTQKNDERLNYFATHTNGMELAEYDMLTRGVGDLVGTAQSGLPKLKFADIMDLELIKRVKKSLN